MPLYNGTLIDMDKLPQEHILLGSKCSFCQLDVSHKAKVIIYTKRYIFSNDLFSLPCPDHIFLYFRIFLVKKHYCVNNFVIFPF
jgi:hypothetical protein